MYIISASTSDGPATTDAALAALAAEAGLIDPVQESSGGLSFMVSADDQSAVDGKGDSCNGNEAAVLAAQLGAGEPMDVDGDGNFIIPQVDGPADFLMEDGEGEGDEEPAAEDPTEDSQENESHEVDEEGDQLPTEAELRLQESLPEENQEDETETETKSFAASAEPTENLPEPEAPSKSETPEPLVKQESLDLGESNEQEEEEPIDENDQTEGAAVPEEPSVKPDSLLLPVAEKKTESEPEVDNSQDEDEFRGDLSALQLEPEAIMGAEQSDSDNVSQADSHPVMDDAGSQDSQTSQEEADTSRAEEDADSESLKLALENSTSHESSSVRSEPLKADPESSPKPAKPATPVPTAAPTILPKTEVQDEPMDQSDDHKAPETPNPKTNGVAAAPVKAPILKKEPVEEKEKEKEKDATSGDSTALTTLATAALGSAGQPVKVKAEMVRMRNRR